LADIGTWIFAIVFLRQGFQVSRRDIEFKNRRAVPGDVKLPV